MTKNNQDDLEETLAFVAKVKARKAAKAPWSGFTVFTKGNQYWRLRATCSRPDCGRVAVRNSRFCTFHGGGPTAVAADPIRTVPHKVRALVRAGQVPRGFVDDPDVKLAMSFRTKKAGPLLADLLEGAVALDRTGDARLWLEAKRKVKAAHEELQARRKANPRPQTGWQRD